MMKNLTLTSILASLLMLAGCSDQQPTNSGVYLLLDTCLLYTSDAADDFAVV